MYDLVLDNIDLIRRLEKNISGYSYVDINFDFVTEKYVYDYVITLENEYRVDLISIDVYGKPDFYIFILLYNLRDGSNFYDKFKSGSIIKVIDIDMLSMILMFKDYEIREL